MALFGVPIVPRDGVFTLSDATGTPITATVQYEDGDLKVDGFTEGFYDTEVFMDRGEQYAVRKTVRRTYGVSFSCHLTDLTDATEKVVLDAICKTGAFAAGISTTAAKGDAWTLKSVWTVEQTNFGAAGDATLTLNHIRWEGSISEGIPAKLSLTGVGYIFADGDIPART